jgi:hypothetical protein
VISILTHQQQIWLGKITEHFQYEALFEWAKASAEAGYLLDLPELFRSHVFDRFKKITL